MSGDLWRAFALLATGLTPGEELARTEAGGLIVSTVDTPDQGPETAILDEAGACPVERYASREAALIGHASWVAAAPLLVDVIKLGYEDVIPSRLVTLRRRRP